MINFKHTIFLLVLVFSLSFAFSATTTISSCPVPLSDENTHTFADNYQLDSDISVVGSTCFNYSNLTSSDEKLIIIDCANHNVNLGSQTFLSLDGNLYAVILENCNFTTAGPANATSDQRAAIVQVENSDLNTLYLKDSNYLDSSATSEAIFGFKDQTINSMDMNLSGTRINHARHFIYSYTPTTTATMDSITITDFTDMNSSVISGGESDGRYSSLELIHLSEIDSTDLTVNLFDLNYTGGAVLDIEDSTGLIDNIDVNCSGSYFDMNGTNNAYFIDTSDSALDLNEVTINDFNGLFSEYGLIGLEGTINYFNVFDSIVDFNSGHGGLFVYEDGAEDVDINFSGTIINMFSGAIDLFVFRNLAQSFGYDITDLNISDSGTLGTSIILIDDHNHEDPNPNFAPLTDGVIRNSTIETGTLYNVVEGLSADSLTITDSNINVAESLFDYNAVSEITPVTYTGTNYLSTVFPILTINYSTIDDNFNLNIPASSVVGPGVSSGNAGSSMVKLLESSINNMDINFDSSVSFAEITTKQILNLVDSSIDSMSIDFNGADFILSGVNQNSVASIVSFEDSNATTISLSNLNLDVNSSTLFNFYTNDGTTNVDNINVLNSDINLLGEGSAFMISSADNTNIDMNLNGTYIYSAGDSSVGGADLYKITEGTIDTFTINDLNANFSCSDCTLASVLTHEGGDIDSLNLFNSYATYGANTSLFSFISGSSDHNYGAMDYNFSGTDIVSAATGGFTSLFFAYGSMSANKTIMESLTIRDLNYVSTNPLVKTVNESPGGYFGNGTFKNFSLLDSTVDITGDYLISLDDNSGLELDYNFLGSSVTIDDKNTAMYYYSGSEGTSTFSSFTLTDLVLDMNHVGSRLIEMNGSTISDLTLTDVNVSSDYLLNLTDATISAGTIYDNYFYDTNNDNNSIAQFGASSITTDLNTVYDTDAANILGSLGLYGNFWGGSSGYSTTCTDADSDGICDSAYTFADNESDTYTDNGPLTTGGLTPPDLNVKSIGLSASSVEEGNPSTITLTYANDGDANITSDYNVEFYVNSSLVNTNEISADLASGSETTSTYAYIPASEGTYTIYAKLVYSGSEVSTSNNTSESVTLTATSGGSSGGDPNESPVVEIDSLASTIDDDFVTLSWTGEDSDGDVELYKIKIQGEGFDGTYEEVGLDTSYEIEGLEEGETYTVTVKVYDDDSATDTDSVSFDVELRELDVGIDVELPRYLRLVDLPSELEVNINFEEDGYGLLDEFNLEVEFIAMEQEDYYKPNKKTIILDKFSVDSLDELNLSYPYEKISKKLADVGFDIKDLSAFAVRAKIDLDDRGPNNNSDSQTVRMVPNDAVLPDENKESPSNGNSGTDSSSGVTANTEEVILKVGYYKKIGVGDTQVLKVYDKDDNPVGGAKVLIEGSDVSFEAETDESGVISYNIPYAGEFDLKVTFLEEVAKGQFEAIDGYSATVSDYFEVSSEDSFVVGAIREFATSTVGITTIVIAALAILAVGAFFFIRR